MARTQIKTPGLANDAVTAAQIAAGAVGTSEIANDAVTAAKIAAGAVGTTEIADSSVTADKIAAGVLSGNFPANWSIPGYQKLPNGFTIQWGQSSALGQQTQIQTFSTPFIGGVFAVIATPISDNPPAGDKRDHWAVYNFTLSNFTLRSWFEGPSVAYNLSLIHI